MSYICILQMLILWFSLRYIELIFQEHLFVPNTLELKNFSALTSSMNIINAILEGHGFHFMQWFWSTVTWKFWWLYSMNLSLVSKH